METRRPIAITGFMGCGKTEVARYLAKRLGVDMIDLDDFITQKEGGRSPARLIREEGERLFRTIETNALEVLLMSKNAGVIALGGGAWIESTNRDLLSRHGAISVWLDTPFDVCWKRIEASPEDRPLGRTKEQASDLYKRRLPIYALTVIRLAAKSSDTPEEIAAHIEAAIAQSNDC